MNRTISAFCLSLVAMLVISACRTGDTSVPEDFEALYLPDMEGLFNYYERAARSGRHKALADSLLLANKDLKASELFVQAAFAYWESGARDSAAAMLHKAIDHGMSNPRILDKFPPPRTFPPDGEWRTLMARLDSVDKRLRELDNFELRTEAMEAFWPYFEKALSDTSQARRQLRAFLFTAPPEVRDFYVVRYGSVDNMFGQMINGAPNYYQYLQRQFEPDSLKPLKQKILTSMRRFREFYPQAVFPKVYIVPGILNSGGTATEMGMFLGGDMYGRSAEMPTEELNDWQQDAIMDFADLPQLTIHELMHFQQHYRDTANQETLLSAVIHEGVCDFMMELCTGEPLQNDNLDFLSEPDNEAWIFGELREELLWDDTSKWLYNGGSIEDRPHDLGYTVGYLICKSYYEMSADKKQAVYDLLNTDDFLEIVRSSGYAYLLELKNTPEAIP